MFDPPPRSRRADNFVPSVPGPIPAEVPSGRGTQVRPKGRPTREGASHFPRHPPNLVWARLRRILFVHDESEPVQGEEGADRLQRTVLGKRHALIIAFTRPVLPNNRRAPAECSSAAWLGPGRDRSAGRSRQRRTGLPPPLAFYPWIWSAPAIPGVQDFWSGAVTRSAR